jgi:hypothetical protein
MFKIKTEKELLELLKIISEEAVNVSRKSLNEVTDPYVGEYKSKYRSDENLFGNLSEQEDESEADEELPEEPPEEEPPEEKSEDEETISSQEGKEFGVSFDSVVTDINTMRSGRSLKNTEIRDELVAYYDRLDENERKALHLFLRELSKILRGAIDGAEAQDPSDPPINLKISFGEEEPEEEVPETDEEPGEDTEEDTTPPIRVNEQQDMSIVRKKIRRLMRG